MNYTYVDAGSIPPLAAGAAPTLLTGISENSYNIIGYYENPRFSLRLAYNHRDGFITEERNPFGDGEKAHAYNQIDATLDVRLSERLTLSLSALNITDSYQRRTTIVTGFPRLLEDNGRRYLVRLRATF